ncbi:Uma2 family endonuclease [Salicibibacter halophilus]|uniref:Uma2 family endonuclease n=1 Tax=Salicibibacter halophilus TaxID=2502791 RepID=A0A514LN63_9BACI|nr:Uma2 family endonuclease [Salicibibacter halophilus]QDI93025.1 Uma2 family endonuclease [Salicibibacter halophilus]
MPQEYTNGLSSYADYLQWDEDVRCEAFDGVIVNMTPSPTPGHQEIQLELSVEFGAFLRGKACKFFTAPLDVCLFATSETSNEEINNWVQPDLMIVCDPKKIDEKRIIGAPDLVIEILSPATARTDRLTKYNKYEEAGVKEYWIVDPHHETVEVFVLQDQSFERADVFTKSDAVKVSLFPDFEVQLNKIFP